eukprot:m.1152298 g.1152298  ORF g.1152298 m.1152298 type:complete len:1204 (+) comp24482_c0_seq2:223-3834(+)
MDTTSPARSMSGGDIDEHNIHMCSIPKSGATTAHQPHGGRKLPIPHLLVEKALVLEHLDRLVKVVQNTGLVPRHFFTLSELLGRIFLVGLGSQCSPKYTLAKFTSAWVAIARLLGISTTSIAEESGENDIDYESMVQSVYLSWIVCCIQRREFASRLRAALENTDEVTRMYHEASLLRNTDDVERILQCVKSMEDHAEIPHFHETCDADMNQEKLIFAKNNVAAFLHGCQDDNEPDGSSSTSLSSVPRVDFFVADAHHPAEIAKDTGYLTVKAISKNLADVTQSDGAGGDSGRGSRTHERQLSQDFTAADDSKARSGRISWTSNEYMTVTGVSASPATIKEAPLPAGWDMAYDPITGHHYYIDHENKQTTWERPSVHVSSEPGVDEATKDAAAVDNDTGSASAAGPNGGTGEAVGGGTTVDDGSADQSESTGKHADEHGLDCPSAGDTSAARVGSEEREVTRRDHTLGGAVDDAGAGDGDGAGDGNGAGDGDGTGDSDDAGGDAPTALVTPTSSPTPRSPPESTRDTPRRKAVTTTYHGEVVVDEKCPAKAFLVRNDPNSDCGTVMLLTFDQTTVSPVVWEFDFRSGGLDMFLQALSQLEHCAVRCGQRAMPVGSAVTTDRRGVEDSAGGVPAVPLDGYREEPCLEFEDFTILYCEDIPAGAPEHASAGDGKARVERRPSVLDQPAVPTDMVTMDNWTTFMDDSGRLTDWNALRKTIFFRGLHPDTRQSAWPFLLGIYPPTSSQEERDDILRNLTEKYDRKRMDILTKSVRESEEAVKILKDVYKDVVRTDREFEFYAGDGNPNLLAVSEILLVFCLGWDDDVPPPSYVQGMSDIVAPMYMTLEHCALAIACFHSNVERLVAYFDGGSGMHDLLEQLRRLTAHYLPELYRIYEAHDMVNFFFCYRWMLLDFKREFPLTDALAIWETIWCKHRTNSFHLFVAMAIMKVYAPADPEKAGGQNLYEYYAQLGGAMEVERVLTHARMLLYETQSHPVPPDLADILRDGSDVSGVDGVECAGGGVGSGGDGDVDGGGEGVGIADCASSEGTDGAQTPDTTQIGVASHVHSSGQINGDANSSTLPSACEDATAVSDITGSDCVAGDPHSEGSPTQLDGATTEPSGSKVPVLTPELLAATPSAVVNTCETAFTVDNNKDVAAALELYLAAIDGLIEHIKSFPKADPAAKIIKRFIKALLCRADYLKQTCL